MNFFKRRDQGSNPGILQWDWILVIVLVPLLLLFTSLILNDTVDPFDEGIHFLVYSLFKTGKIPYLDFYPTFPPIWTYSNIIIEWIFGEYLLVQRLWFVFQGLIIVFACYGLLKRFYSSRLLTLGVVALIITFGLNTYWLPRWGGIRLALYIFFFLLYVRHIEKTEKGASLRLFFLGFFVGASNLYAFDTGIHLTGIGIGLLVYSFFGYGFERLRLGARSLFICVAGFFVPLIIWALYLALNGAFFKYIYTYYYVFIIQLAPITTKILSSVDLTNGQIMRFIMISLLLLFLGVGLIYVAGYRGIIKRDLSKRNRLIVLGLALSFVVSTSALRVIEGSQYQMFGLIPILIWGGFLADFIAKTLAARSLQKKMTRAIVHILVLIMLAGASYAITIHDTKHKIIALRTNLLMTKLLYNGTVRDYMDLSIIPKLSYLEYSKFDELTTYLKKHTGPEETILAFPMYTEIIPALAERKSATSYPIPMLIMGSPKLQKEYIREIAREKPEYVVLCLNAKFGDIESITPYFRPVYLYLLQNYSPVREFRQGRHYLLLKLRK